MRPKAQPQPLFPLFAAVPHRMVTAKQCATSFSQYEENLGEHIFYWANQESGGVWLPQRSGNSSECASGLIALKPYKSQPNNGTSKTTDHTHRCHGGIFRLR